MASGFTNNTTDQAILAVVTAAGGPLNGTQLGLWERTGYTPSRTTTLADLPAASYTGYALQAITWNPPVLNDAGAPEVVSEQLRFVPTGPSPDKLVNGWMLLNAAGTALIASGQFSNPIPMTNTMQDILINVRFPMSSSMSDVTIS